MKIAFKWRIRILMLVPALLVFHMATAAETIGWVAYAKIYPDKIILRSRMDTGAKTSSLRGNSIKHFTRNGTEWISIEIHDKKHHVYSIERQVVRNVKIKRHNESPVQRPVIKMGICVGDVYKEVEVTITERSGFNYPLLIGRNFLKGSFLIDSAHTSINKPACIVKQ